MYYIDEDDLPSTTRVRKDDGTTEVIPQMTYREWRNINEKESSFMTRP